MKRFHKHKVSLKGRRPWRDASNGGRLPSVYDITHDIRLICGSGFDVR
jgi:hypothetical protein